MARPKDIGTAAETAAARALHLLGFPHAERRALSGAHDRGDITGTPGVVWEVKGGAAAKSASDGQVLDWLIETETERVNARADVGVLVMQRAGYGPARASEWWAVLSASWTFNLAPGVLPALIPVRLHLRTACALLRARGYGTTPGPGAA